MAIYGSKHHVSTYQLILLFCVSIQFLPHSGDRILITGAADTKVHVHDLSVKETIHMFSDHTNRVKRIATAPMWPNTFWSAAEDGIIRFTFKLKLKHTLPLILLQVMCLHSSSSPQAVRLEGEQ